MSSPFSTHSALENETALAVVGEPSRPTSDLVDLQRHPANETTVAQKRTTERVLPSGPKYAGYEG